MNTKINYQDNLSSKFFLRSTPRNSYYIYKLKFMKKTLRENNIFFL